MKYKSTNHLSMKKLAILLLFSVAVMGFHSCEQYEITFSVDFQSYNSDIQPIFDADCIGCHPALIGPDLTAASSHTALTTQGFVDLQTPENSKIYTKLQAGSHSSYTITANKELILEWIKQGAPNN